LSRVARLIPSQQRLASRPVPRPIPDGFTQEMLNLNQAAAKRHGVESMVHPQDFIYWFCATHPSWTIEQGIEYYFWDGGRSARHLAEGFSGLGLCATPPVNLLEFASGYGCVSRHLKKTPQLELFSCDIHPAATNFISDRLGVRSALSNSVPEHFCPAEKFDVVFALSFFSHMPRSSFG